MIQNFLSAILIFFSSIFNSFKTPVIPATPTLPTIVLATPAPTLISEPILRQTTKPAVAVSNPTPRANTASTPAPTSTPTPTSAQTSNSCNYDLSGPTGAVKINIKPQGGMVVGDQTVELHSQNGCKVLDGRSTDTYRLVARSNSSGYSSQNSVTYSSVPAGSYSARIQYKGEWTGYLNVEAVSGSSRDLDFYVSGSTAPTPTPTPTPTPLPKSTCAVNIVSTNGLTVQLVASVSIFSTYDKYTTATKWDFEGDGNWDLNNNEGGILSHTYPNPGTYNIRSQVQLSDGEVTDVCSKDATVQ